MKITKKHIKDTIIFVVEVAVFFVIFQTIISYAVNKRCQSIYEELVPADADNGPRRFDDYSEEELQVYSIVIEECIYDLNLKYEGRDGEEFYIVYPCSFVAKDVVRAIFNPGTLSKNNTIHDVFEKSKKRVIKVSLEKGMITKK